jgi:hypothetical protein
MGWFVGSGATARSYLLAGEGYLYESPVAYYTAGRRHAEPLRPPPWSEPGIACERSHGSGERHIGSPAPPTS